MRETPCLREARSRSGPGASICAAITHNAAEANPTGFGQPLQPGGDIDPIAEDVMLLSDHVTEIDTDPELYPLLWRGARIPLGHAALELDGAAHRVHHARELCQ